MCSYLSDKYEQEINQQTYEMGVKMTVIRGQDLPPKEDSALVCDLFYFHLILLNSRGKYAGTRKCSACFV